MRRFLVFKFDNYYPEGGMNDCCESFYTLEKAKDYANSQTDDEVQIFDRLTGDVYIQGKGRVIEKSKYDWLS